MTFLFYYENNDIKILHARIIEQNSMIFGS